MKDRQVYHLSLSKEELDVLVKIRDQNQFRSLNEALQRTLQMIGRSDYQVYTNEPNGESVYSLCPHS